MKIFFVSHRFTIRLALCLFGLAVLIFFVVGAKRTFGGVKSQDFVPVYAGCRCFLNSCNPYSIDDLERSFLEGGGRRVDQAGWYAEMPIYPPSSLLLLAALGILPYQVARIVWFALNGTVFVTGCLLSAYLSDSRDRALNILLAAVVLIGSTALPALGNPAGFSIGCLLIAVWSAFRRHDRNLFLLFLSLSLVIKPQLTIVIAAAFLCSKTYRKQAFLGIVIACGLLAVSVAWLQLSPVQNQWMVSLKQNLSNTLLPAGSNSPTPFNRDAMRMTNLQTVFAAFTNNGILYDLLSWAFTAILASSTLLMLLPFKGTALFKTFAIAACTMITLMPVYHRTYDAKLMLLCVPAVLSLRRAQPILGALLLIAMIPICFSVSYQMLAQTNFRLISEGTSPWKLLFLGRQTPFALFVMTIIFFLWLR